MIKQKTVYLSRKEMLDLHSKHSNFAPIKKDTRYKIISIVIDEIRYVLRPTEEELFIYYKDVHADLQERV